MVWWYGWQVIALTFLGVLTCYVSALNLVLASIAYIAFEHMQVWTLHWMDSQTGMYIHLCNWNEIIDIIMLCNPVAMTPLLIHVNLHTIFCHYVYDAPPICM